MFFFTTLTFFSIHISPRKQVQNFVSPNNVISKTSYILKQSFDYFVKYFFQKLNYKSMSHKLKTDNFKVLINFNFISGSM